MASNYNIIHVVKDLLTGNLKKVPVEISQQRIDICNQCEVQNKALQMCTACGCFLPAKVRLKKASCPMELWAEHTDD